MNIYFLDIICCPDCQKSLKLSNEKKNSRDILEGNLQCFTCNSDYLIIDGIPRFVSDKNYNKSWDFKWSKIDGGRGLAYLSIDKNDPAYDIHGIFDKNSYNGEPFI